MIQPVMADVVLRDGTVVQFEAMWAEMQWAAYVKGGNRLGTLVEYGNKTYRVEKLARVNWGRRAVVYSGVMSGDIQDVVQSWYDGVMIAEGAS